MKNYVSMHVLEIMAIPSFLLDFAVLKADEQKRIMKAFPKCCNFA
jgi:hypothetical protein